MLPPTVAVEAAREGAGSALAVERTTLMGCCFCGVTLSFAFCSKVAVELHRESRVPRQPPGRASMSLLRHSIFHQDPPELQSGQRLLSVHYLWNDNEQQMPDIQCTATHGTEHRRLAPTESNSAAFLITRPRIFSVFSYKCRLTT